VQCVVVVASARGDQVAGLRTPLKGFYVELAQRLHCSGDIHKIGIGPTAR